MPRRAQIRYLGLGLRRREYVRVGGRRREPRRLLLQQRQHVGRRFRRLQPVGLENPQRQPGRPQDREGKPGGGRDHPGPDGRHDDRGHFGKRPAGGLPRRQSCRAIDIIQRPGSHAMPKLDDAAYGDIAATLRARVDAHAPEWTDNNESDPGILLLELFAFITESLLYRQNLIPDRGRSSAARLATFAQALADRTTGAPDHTLVRPRYFAGQLLGADDFSLEQDYFRHRLRRLNREVIGAGVVRGLGVSVQPDDSGTGQRVVVEPGFAIDPHGEEIEACGAATAALPPTGGLLYVTLHHAERPTHPQPAAN